MKKLFILVLAIVLFRFDYAAQATPILYGGFSNGLYRIDHLTGNSTTITTSGGFQADRLAFVPSPVPEPSTVLLLGIGLALLAGGAARRKQKAVNKDRIIIYQLLLNIKRCVGK